MHGMTRTASTVLFLTLVAWMVPSTLHTAHGELLVSEELNFEIETPPGWTRLPADESWSPHGIVVGSIRELDRLKDASPAKGEGGELYLAITDAPAGKTLDDLAADPEVRGFLLKRFDVDPAKWPEVTVAAGTNEDGLETRILQADGEAPNLEGRKAPVRAVLILAKAKGKLCKLRMYAWHSEHDAEGLKADLDFIEVHFRIPDLGEEPPEETPGGGPPDGGDEANAPEGDEAVEREVEDEVVGWRLVKPVGIRTREEYDKQKYKDVAVWFEDSDPVGSYQIILYVVERGRRDENNRVMANIPLKAWALDRWWPEFDEAHEDGPVHTYGWPRRSKSFLTLPDWGNERTVFSEPRKRPPTPLDVDGNDLIRRYKVAEKIKNQKVGKTKPNGGYRGVLAGNRELVGREWVIRYVWDTPRLTCYLVISITRDGRKKFSDRIQSLLESIEMTDPARGR